MEIRLDPENRNYFVLVGIKHEWELYCSYQFPFRFNDNHDCHCRHATVYLISSSLLLPAILHPDRSLAGAFFSVRILVPLLYSFITFRFYEAHFETRKNEPLRIDNPFQDSHCLSRITFIFTSPVSTSVLLSLAEHMRCFSG